MNMDTWQFPNSDDIKIHFIISKKTLANCPSSATLA